MSLLIVFVIGYFLIVTEGWTKINKTASALLTGIACWVIYAMLFGSAQASVSLSHHLGSISEILFFLLGAMTIVELVDAHQGFDVITGLITSSKKKQLLWIVSLITFFLSAALDNLTTAIVMVTLLRKIIEDKTDRMLFAGFIIIAANAGGAWSPIGDVTTSMLWIGGQISALNIMLKLFLPSLISLLVPLVFLSFRLNGNIQTPVKVSAESDAEISPWEKRLVFYSALLLLFFVPLFKMLSGLPPYLGILLGLSVLWVLTELLHKSKENKQKELYSVVSALQRIDVTSILFFLGILLAISSLDSAGLLSRIASELLALTQSKTIISLIIGLCSSIVDNVPLVAACMGMFHYPMDDFFWEFIAYCAGTGGSILVIGSAAGVAVMGLEKIEFGWYLKKMSGLALIGYLSGAVVYLFLAYFFKI